MADITTLSKIILTAEDKTANAFASVKSNFQELITGGKAITGILGALGALGAGAFLFSVVKGAIDTTAAFKDMSEKSGLAVETLSALKTAATLTGTDFQTVVKGGEKLAKTLYDAAGSGGEAAAAFKAVGVDIRDAAGAIKSQDAILLEVAQRFSEMEDGTAKTALAQKLLGKSGAELIPILNDIGAAGEYVAKVTTEQAAIADDLQKTWIKLTTSGKGMWTTIAAQITPALDAAAHGFLNVLNAAGGLKGKVAELAADGTFASWAQKGVIILAEIADAIVDVINFLGRLWESVKTGSGVFSAFGQIMSGVVKIFSGDLTEGLASISQGWDKMKQTGSDLSKVWDGFGASHTFRDSVMSQIVAMSAGVEQSKKYAGAIVDLKATGEAAAKALADAFAAVAHAQQELDDLGKAADSKTSPAMRKLIDLLGDPAFQKFSASMRAAIQDAYLSADAIQHETAARKAALEVQAAFIKNLDDILDRFAKQKAQLDAELDSLQRYGIATASSAQATAEFEMTQGKLAATLTLLDATFPDVSAAIRAYVTEQAKAVDVSNALKKSEEEYQAVRKAAIEDMARGIDGLTKEIEAEKMRAASIGLTRAEMINLHIAQEQAYLDNLRTAEGSEIEIRAAEIRIAKWRELQTAVGNTDTLAKTHQAWVDLFNDVSRAGADFIVDFVNHGSSAFKNLWENFKQWALRAFAEIAAKKIAVSLIGTISGGAAGSVDGGGGAGGGGLLDLLKLGKQGYDLFGGGTGGVGMIESLLTTTSVGSSIGAMLGLTTTAAEMGAGAAAFGLAAEGATAALTTFGASMLAVVPVVGWIAAAALIAWQIWGNKGGGPKAGGFASSGDTSSITNTDMSGRWFTPNQTDADLTKTVEAVKNGYTEAMRALGLTGKNVGFALGFDTDPQGTAPNRIHAGTFVDGRQVYDAALGDLGRDDKVLQERLTLETKRILFAAIQASLSDAPKYMQTLFDGIDAATVTSEDIDRILSTAQALKVIVAAIGGMGDQFAKMDANQIGELVAAFGGLQNFLASANFIGTNFTTDADRAKIATAGLAAAFDSLGLKVPASHDAFLDLLASFDLTTESGRTLYASVSSLAPAFIALNGTAEQAAAALQKVRDELASFQTDNFTTDSQKHQGAIDQVTGDFTALGVAVPKTHADFLKLIPTLNLTDQQVLDLEKDYVAAYGSAQDMANAERDLTQARQEAIASAEAVFQQGFYTDAEQAQRTINAGLTTLADAGKQLGISIPSSIEGFRHMIEGIDRGTEAGEALYQTLILLAPTVLDIANATDKLTNSANAAAEAQDRLANAYDRSVQAAGEAQSAFNAIWSGIQELVSGSGGTFGEKLALTMKLIPEEIAKVQNQLDAAMSRGELYSPLVYQLNALLTQLGQANQKATAQLARYTILSAQYDAARAEQLINLEDWYEKMKAALAASPEALAALQVQFDAKWKAIIDGTQAGVEGTQSELVRLQKSIREFLDSLKLSDLSPLTPTQKLAEAKSQYEELLAKAQGGDLEALGKLTGAAQEYLKIARDFYASSTAYTEIFNSVVAALEKLAAPEAGTKPDVHIDPIERVLPSSGTLVTKEDLDASNRMLAAEFAESISAVVNAVNENSATNKQAVNQQTQQLQPATLK